MKLALVHDWLTGMRGGEKCLEVLCRRFPDARLFALLHVPGSTSHSACTRSTVRCLSATLRGAGKMLSSMVVSF